MIEPFRKFNQPKSTKMASHYFLFWFVTRTVNLRILIYLICFGFVLSSAFSQYSETLYTVNDGLPHILVHDITSDANGFIWLYTRNGVCRFDGSQFKPYKMNYKGQTVSLSFQGLFVKDKNKRIWIKSTIPHFVYYDIHTDQMRAVHETYYGSYLMDVECDSAGNHYCTTGNQFIRLKDSTHFSFARQDYYWPKEAGRIDNMHRFEDGKMIATMHDKLFRIFMTKDSLKLEKIKVVSTNNNEYALADSTRFLKAGDKLWLVSRNMILKTTLPASGYFTDSVVVVEPLILDFPEINLNNGDDFQGVIQGEKDELYIRSDGGIYRYNIPGSTAERIKIEAYGKRAAEIWGFRRAFFYGGNGILWAGCDKGLLKIVVGYKPFKLLTTPTENSAGLKPYVDKVVIDSNQDLWIFQKGLGLLHSSPDLFGEYKDFRIFRPESNNNTSIHSKDIRRLKEDSQHRLWLIVGNNIQWMDLNKPGIFHYSSQKTLFDQYGIRFKISNLFEDPAGNILATTPSMNLSWLITPDAKNAYVITLDSLGTIARWPTFVKTKNGELYMHSGSKFYQLDTQWILNDDSLIMSKDKKNQLVPWAYPKKINLLFKVDSLDNFLSIIMLTEHAGNQEVWLDLIRMDKLLRCNLNVLKANRDNPSIALSYYPSKEDEYLERKTEWIMDKKGNIWYATSNGLIKINAVSGEYLTFYMDDGLPTNTFSSGADMADNGTLYMSTRKGLLFFHPDSIHPDPPPRVKITELELFNKSVEVKANSFLPKSITYLENLRLNHNQNFIGLGFTAVDYRNTKQIRYKYKMEGLDRDWIKSDHRHKAEYPNLRPGKYTFRVIAANGNGVWNNDGASLDILIRQPWWFRWWAVGIEILLLFALLMAFIRYRERNLKQQAILLGKKVDEKTHEILEQRKEVDELKSRFYTNISHEFRTPLTLLEGPLEDSVKMKEDVVPMSKKMLKVMLRNTRRLHRLINQLLDISKLESGKMKLQLVKGNLSEHVRVITSSFLSLAESKQITFNLKIPDHKNEVCFDSDKVEKVLTNLLSNAFKFTREGGRVSLVLSYVSADNLKGQQDAAKVIVRDTGKGIMPEKLAHIFERFYQVSNSETREVEGSGIGLALTKELIDLMHGHIEVEGKLNEGTTFTIRIPVNPDCFSEQEIASIEAEMPDYQKPELEREATEEIETIHSPDKKGDLILIVEDNADLRKYISDHFAKHHRILTAENGSLGYDLSLKRLPDLVITDLMMPVMGGLEMCRKLKEHPLTNHIPIVMLTAKADKESKLEGLEAAADDYISKPFDSEELMVRAKNLIRQRKDLRASFEKRFLTDSVETDTRSPQFSFLHAFMEVFEQHISDQDYNIKDLAEELQLSRSHIFRKVNAVAGTTPNKLMTLVRMKHAAKLLRTGDFNVIQVMNQVGMQHPSYFASQFKKLYGKNPGEYAKNG